ncbi:Hypothetical predicted protein [Mytilus galloprovincialis]|uniref:Methyltransferase type 11 domain-containing protein n=2 Tax=Mytilus galloprovincialis TaxID=29158 RepID=A0A8B6GRU1_MYTGA|nr:Hypothetical predicted protein [Mytilus galloprovincialis]
MSLNVERKPCWKLSIILTILLLLLSSMYAVISKNPQIIPNMMKTNCPTEVSGKTNNPEFNGEVLNGVWKMRNQLSQQLNEMSRTVGRLQCENSNKETSNKGGWCKDTSYEDSGSHLTDKALIPTLSSFLRGKKVASFGDGPGAYKREILKLGQVKSYDAYDGAPFCEETSEGRVKFMDLTIPQYGIPLYDWILSLEVAEHIPKRYESVYLDNIFRHARAGIILSWATRNQGGTGHINEQSPQYVLDIMEKNGFYRDEKSSKQLRKSSTLWWLAKNTNVYRRISYKQFEENNTIFKWYL